MEIIFHDRSFKEIKKEGYNVLGYPGTIRFKTPIKLFSPLIEKLEEVIKDFNSDKNLKTNFYAVFQDKEATPKELFYYTVYALKITHQKP